MQCCLLTGVGGEGGGGGVQGVQIPITDRQFSD